MRPSAPQPLSVSELTRQIRDLLQANFDQVVCVGEISNLVRARSGHLYFTLKDDEAQISAVMWKTRAQRLRFELRDGLEVVVVGPIEVYPPRGSYQLIVEQALPQGMGPLELAFRQLQEKLAAEGLFDPARKRPLPRFPGRVALVTSPTGAAVRDMLQVLTRRWPLTNLVIVPVPVQGPKAAPAIARGLADAARIPGVEVIITGRGGGSLEDLWPFNEEVVARAIANSPIPVVSAVGHEIDVSIADLVADRRALTPTEAAEFVVPNLTEIQQAFRELSQRLGQSLRQQAQQSRRWLELLSQRRVFQKPQEMLSLRRRDLDELDQQLTRHLKQRLQQAGQEIQAISARLEALSPLRVLARGYTITREAETGRVVKTIQGLTSGQRLQTDLPDGSIVSEIQEFMPRDTP